MKITKGVRKMESNKEELVVEERVLEELLKDLREEKNWTYIHIVEELSKLGLLVDEKLVKKWEIGLEYPDLDAIYKLSELFFIPSETFIMAKTNSYKKGLESVHMILIKWICYFTGFSIKAIYIGIYVILGGALIWALMFFMDMVEIFNQSRS